MQPWSCLRQLLGGFSCSEKAWFNENRSPEAVLVSHENRSQKPAGERGGSFNGKIVAHALLTQSSLAVTSTDPRQVSWHPHQRCGDERGPLPPIRESILRTIQGRISSIGLVAALHTSTRTEKALLHVGPLSNTWSRQNQSMRRGRSVASLLSTQIAAVKANTAKKSSQACRRQLPIHGFAPAADAELRFVLILSSSI